MKKVQVGICQVSFLQDILKAIKNKDYQLLRDYGYEQEIEDGFVEMWVDDLLENFCKPLIEYDKDTEIILEEKNMKNVEKNQLKRGINMTNERKAQLFDEAMSWIYEQLSYAVKLDYKETLKDIGFTEEEITEELSDMFDEEEI